MRAARSDSPRMTSRPCACVFSSTLRFSQAFGPRQDRRERIVQFVRDAGDGLAERGHFFGLEHLVTAVSILVVPLLPLRHVTDQRFDDAAPD